MIEKDFYKSKYPLYRSFYGLVQIVDGLANILVGPFGYQSSLYPKFCVKVLLADVKRKRFDRDQRTKEMKEENEK